MRKGAACGARRVGGKRHRVTHSQPLRFHQLARHENVGNAGGVVQNGAMMREAATAAQSSATVTGRRTDHGGQTHCGGGVIDASGVGTGIGPAAAFEAADRRTVMS